VTCAEAAIRGWSFFEMLVTLAEQHFMNIGMLCISK